MAGCGEVKKVHDALCRTVLSAATTMEGANNSLQTLIKTFGVVHQGTEEESVDWDKIRLAFHSRINVAWKGDGDVHLVIKGSRDPYVVT